MPNPQLHYHPNPKGESFSEVIFLETDTSLAGFKFVEDNFERLATLFGKSSYDLVSIKHKLNKWQTTLDLEALMTYHFPLLYSTGVANNKSVLENPNIVGILSRLLLSSYGINVEQFSGFMLFHGRDIVLIDLSCTNPNCIDEIEFLLEEKIICFLHYYYDEDCAMGMPRNKDSIVNYEKNNGDPANIADELFPLEAHLLAHEVMERVNKLKRDGFEKLLVESLSQILFANHSNAETLFDGVSRLRITDDYRIVLPDYGNLEVELTPLPKVVFLFFLRHPEGVVFKRLYEHREELMAIYIELSLRENFAAMQRSIEELIDPTKNSINEKCSRIKEAFVKLMDNQYASHYYITGDRGEEKRITLDRNIVSWDNELGITSVLAKTNNEIARSNEDELSLIKKAEDLRENGMRSKAIELLSGVIGANPYCAVALHIRAIAYYELQRSTLAVDDYTRVLEINDMHTSAYYNRAIAHVTLNNFNDAINDLTRCISLLSQKNSLLPKAYRFRAQVYTRQQKASAALSDYKVAASLGCEESKQFLENY